MDLEVALVHVNNIPTDAPAKPRLVSQPKTHISMAAVQGTSKVNHIAHEVDLVAVNNQANAPPPAPPQPPSLPCTSAVEWSCAVDPEVDVAHEVALVAVGNEGPHRPKRSRPQASGESAQNPPQELCGGPRRSTTEVDLVVCSPKRSRRLQLPPSSSLLPPSQASPPPGSRLGVVNWSTAVVSTSLNGTL